MGNNAAAGHVMAMTGLPQAAGFHKTLGQLMYQYNIQPWDPKVLLANRLQQQQELQKTSPLRFIQVEDGLRFYASQLGGNFLTNSLGREKFVEMSLALFRQKGLHLPVEEARLFYDIFDSIDLYKNATLSVGELAGGLSSFFGGTVEAKTSAVFDLLAGSTGQVPKEGLNELLKPYVWCMVPDNAEVLRPLLLPHVAEEVYNDMSMSGTGYLTRNEMQRWAQKGQFAQGAASEGAVNMSFTIIDRAALAINIALQVAWREYEGKYALREYGQQTWTEHYGDRPQQITDVGATRYAAQRGGAAYGYAAQAAPGAQATAGTVLTQVGQVGGQLLQGAATGLGQFSTWLATDNDNMQRRGSVQSVAGGRRLSVDNVGLGGTTTMIIQPQSSAQPQMPVQQIQQLNQAWDGQQQVQQQAPPPPPAPQPAFQAPPTMNSVTAPAAQPQVQLPSGGSPFQFGNLNVIPGLNQAPQSARGAPQAQMQMQQPQMQMQQPRTMVPQQYQTMAQPQFQTMAPMQMRR